MISMAGNYMDSDAWAGVVVGAILGFMALGVLVALAAGRPARPGPGPMVTAVDVPEWLRTHESESVESSTEVPRRMPSSSDACPLTRGECPTDPARVARCTEC